MLRFARFKVWDVIAADFAAHCSEIYHQRMAELDGELCRLALLLQPQYKLVAVPDGNALPLIHQVLIQAIFSVSDPV